MDEACVLEKNSDMYRLRSSSGSIYDSVATVSQARVTPDLVFAWRRFNRF